MGREVTTLWQTLTAMEEQLTHPSEGRHEDSEQHRVFCDERFCLERGPLDLEGQKAA